MDFRRSNLIGGWLVFLVATAVYVLSIEPTTSFWDCGEFIATAFKLEVGHPPGAPFFMILARVLTIFAEPESAAYMVNLLSALSSSLTILFLFWTITALAKKLATVSGEMTKGKTIAILGSSMVGALAYTFSDTFWFSAVEGEVYAMSSLFTAIVFWAILKYDGAEAKYESRWLILIAYVIGLSIGVHLLSLLCIPAITFVYYFKKYKVTAKGIVATGIIAMIVLGIVQVGIIAKLVVIAAGFERVFVNSFSLPFNSGLLVFMLLLIGGLGYGIYYTQKRNKVAWNTIMLSFLIIIIGYSSFAMILIRSAANPPMDENDPEHMFSLLAYLNREQYGDSPLLFGQYWDTPSDPQNPRKDGSPVYMPAYSIKDGGRTIRSFKYLHDAEKFLAQNKNERVEMVEEYIVSDEKKRAEVNYNSKLSMLFPRMWSPQDHHIRQYKAWTNFKGKKMEAHDPSTGAKESFQKPTQAENLSFFMRYQINWMYWRYFMWNFAGRQNDVQGHGFNLEEGHWLSGLPFIDEQKLGNQEYLPENITENKAYNRLYLIPLILGLIGLMFQLWRSAKDWFVVFLLFFFTGFAIVLFLNQYPIQPRERDYAFVGSFYAFAIWIGLGVYALYEAAISVKRSELTSLAIGSLGLSALIYVFELAGEDHTFSYCLFFISGVMLIAAYLMKGIGTAIKNDVVPAVFSVLICLPVPIFMGFTEWDDHVRANRYTARDFSKNYLDSCAPNAILFTNGDNDTFPLWYAQEVEGYRTDVRVVNLSLLNTDWYIDQMKRKAYDSDPVPFGLEEYQYRQGTRDVIPVIADKNTTGKYVDVKLVMDFVTSEKNKGLFGGGERMNYIPTTKFSMKVDKAAAIASGAIPRELHDSILTEIQWDVPKRMLLKNQLMVLDLLANNDWTRPIYFAVTTGPDSYLGLEEHFQLEGLTYRLIPIKTSAGPNPNLQGRVNTEIMYDNIMNKFRWGGLDEFELYMDENNLRMTNNMRLQFSNLAEALVQEGKKEKAIAVLDRAVEVLPDKNVPYSRIMLSFIDLYHKLGEVEKASAINDRLMEIYDRSAQYYFSLAPEDAALQQDDMRWAVIVLQRLSEFAEKDGGKTAEEKEGIKTLSDKYEADYYKVMQQIEGLKQKK